MGDPGRLQPSTMMAVQGLVWTGEGLSPQAVLCKAVRDDIAGLAEGMCADAMAACRTDYERNQTDETVCGESSRAGH
jgi:hypothetical protein